MSLSKIIRIGTRDSALALWQAKAVEKALAQKGYRCRLIPLKSPGDLDLHTPLHQFGSVGIFTKFLDDCLLRQEIDLAVHSLKDYPTQAPAELTLGAVLPRGESGDVLVLKDPKGVWQDDPQSKASIATGSIRRQAQWLRRYPRHRVVNLRGNVNTRLRKVAEGPALGGIFAEAGLQRLGLLPAAHLKLDWMLPAPGQGTVAVACLSDRRDLRSVLAQIDHGPTARETQAERSFLRRVEGGCSAPVGAKAQRSGDKLLLRAAVFSLNGRQTVEKQAEAPLDQAPSLGESLAEAVLAAGGREIMDSIAHDS